MGPKPPSKCLEHIRVCLVTLKLSSRHATIHLRRLSRSFIPGAYCVFSLSGVKQWKVTSENSGYLSGCFFFASLWNTCTHNNDVWAFSREIATQTRCVPLTFPRISHTFMLYDLLVPGPSGNTNIVYYLCHKGIADDS